MPTKSQPPCPNPAITSRKAKNTTKGTEAEGKSAGRPGSAGGIILEKDKEMKEAKDKGKAEGKMSPATPAKSTTEGKDAVTPATANATPSSNQTAPNRQRRRPRKLNKEPTVAQNATSSTGAAATAPAAVGTEMIPPAATTELEALKSRVRGLEAKVEELYKSGGGDRSGRSPRRRGKGRKGSSTSQLPTTSTPEPGKVEELDDDADEELVRLEGELEVARQDLESFRPRPRPRTRRSDSGETEYIEEIPRGAAGVEEMADTGDRKVTLTGNYRIPLPANVSMDDVRNIQSGVTAAQNVAKGFLEQRRARQAVQNPTQPAKTAPPRAKQGTSTEVMKDGDGGGKTWSEWFGGYSVAVSRAVKTIEAEAAVESQKKTPAQPGRTPSAKPTPTSAKPKPKPKSATAAKGGQRPGMKSRAGNLSSEQVQGLMS